MGAKKSEMKNEKIIEILNLFLNHQQSPEDKKGVLNGVTPATNALYYISELYSAAMEEIAEETTKKARGASYVSLSKKIQKELEKETREHLRFAWFENIGGEDFQCFITRGAAILFCLREHLDLPQDYDPKINAARLLPKSATLNDIAANYAEIIAKIKSTPKAERKKNHIVIGEKTFSPDLVLHAFEVLGGIDRHEQSAHRWCGDVIHGARGFAFILPCRPANGCL